MKKQSGLTQTICPDCGRSIFGVYARDGGAVYLEKNCPDHGSSRVLASENADEFERWIAFQSVTVPPSVFITKGFRSNDASGGARKHEQIGASGGAREHEQIYASGGAREHGQIGASGGAREHGQLNAEDECVMSECPLHCGVCENHLMTACCVLLNVTERCNQHCPYCFANAGTDTGTSGSVLDSSPASETAVYRPPSMPLPDPPLEDIGRWLDRLIELGEERKFNIQLNGGEPTVRDDLPDIIRLCKEKEFEYVQLNTNGRRLSEDPGYAMELKAAGLTTVFLQFDGVTDDIYIALRGEPLLETKKAAIRNCAVAGLPVTLVPTITKSANLKQCGAIIDFMLENISVVKGVHFQPASFFGRKPDERNEDGDFDERVTMFAVMDEIEKQTSGRIQKSDLAPISTGHPLCCFCAAYMKERGGVLKPLSSGGSCCGPEPDPLETIRRDRDFVLNKWDVTIPGNPADDSPCECGAASGAGAENSGRNAFPDSVDGAMSFDEALAMFRTNMFTISGMAFMDETNLDAERLRRCRVQVFTPDERLIPFCGYYAIFNR